MVAKPGRKKKVKTSAAVENKHSDVLPDSIPHPTNGIHTPETATSVMAPSTPDGIEADANISIREYIYFLPYPLPTGTPVPYSTGLPQTNPLKLPNHQFEPTSTLVLTSPKHTFVDVRLFKPFQSSATGPLPNEGETERLEWAFGGTSLSQHIAQPKKHGSETDYWEGVTHSTWTHWVDSRHAVGSANIPVDEGNMYPITPELTLEHGHAFQPLMNSTKTHEEMWRDVQILSTSPIGTKLCVVLRLQADSAGVRGVIVRLGQYCQGIVMQGTHCTIERWEFGSEEEEEDKKGTGDWKRTARVGDQYLPCSATFRPEVMTVGGIVKYFDYEWVVEECWEWE